MVDEIVSEFDSPSTAADSSTHDLLVRFQLGDLVAIESLYIRYWGAFRRFAIRQGLGIDEAEDAAQNAFERIIDAIETYNTAKSGGERWMWRICRTEISRTFRMLKAQSTHAPLPVTHVSWFEEWPLGPEFVRCLTTTFTTLSEKEQKVIRNRESSDPGREPDAIVKWRNALLDCYGELDHHES